VDRFIYLVSEIVSERKVNTGIKRRIQIVQNFNKLMERSQNNAKHLLDMF
jgi:hypothetical protein